jgi:hypothetical protein
MKLPVAQVRLLRDISKKGEIAIDAHAVAALRRLGFVSFDSKGGDALEVTQAGTDWLLANQHIVETVDAHRFRQGGHRFRAMYKPDPTDPFILAKLSSAVVDVPFRLELCDSNNRERPCVPAHCTLRHKDGEHWFFFEAVDDQGSFEYNEPREMVIGWVTLQRSSDTETAT